MKKYTVFNIFSFLILFVLINLTGCKWFTFGGDFSEVINEALETKVDFFDTNPFENENHLKAERSYKIGSRQASIDISGDDFDAMKRNHVGYKLLGWKYLCNGLDNSVTKLPKDLELDENGCIAAFTITADPIWIYGVWIEADDTPYTVKHWTQNNNLDGYDIYREEILTGTTNKQTDANALEIDGFTSLTFAQVKIAPDGTSEVNIYYDRKKINITVNINGSTKTYSGYYDQSLTSDDYELSDFAPTGFVFDKWNVEYKDETTDELSTEYITFKIDGAVYTCIWKELTFGITYVLLPDGTPTVSAPAWATDFVPIEEYSYSTSVTLPSSTDVIRAGYEFGGWYEDASFVNAVSQINAGDLKNKTVYAKWIPVVYAINYNLNGGNWVGSYLAPTNFTVEDSITLPSADLIQKTGYIFVGWYTDISFVNSISEITAGTTSDIELYVSWGMTPAQAGNITITLPNTNDASIELEEPIIVKNALNTKVSVGVWNVVLPDSATVASYDWYVNGTWETSEGAEVTLTFFDPGVYQVVVVIRDNNGKSYYAEMNIQITKQIGGV